MAATRIMPIHIRKGTDAGKAIERVLDYIENPEKTENKQLVSSFQCNAALADKEFLLLRKQYLEKTGRNQRNAEVLAYHIRQSFVPGEITPEEANRLGTEFAHRFTRDQHAFVVCTHVDKAHIHNHIVWSSTTLDCTHKFRNFKNSEKAVRNLSDMICMEHGYSTIENPERHGKSYDQWLGAKVKPSHREELRIAIDEIIAHKPESINELFDVLTESGYEIKGRNSENPSFRKRGQARYMRLDTLGENYEKQILTAVISGTQKHLIHKSKHAAKNPESGSLLIDIEAKLREGKGGGYENWAKSYNLKQIAKTVLYLQEQKLMDRDELEQRIESASERISELSGKIKAADERMKEISALRTQIVNYAKTRDVYQAYKQRGYSKEFFAEHESEILSHAEAKAYFGALGNKKLPKISELQKEYASLLQTKRDAYAELKIVRTEWKSLVTARLNIERFLNYEDTISEKTSALEK